MLELNEAGCVRPLLCSRCGSSAVKPPWTICWTCFNTEPPKPAQEPAKLPEQPPAPEPSLPTPTGNTVPIWQLDACSIWPVDGVALLPEPKQSIEPVQDDTADEPDWAPLPAKVVIPGDVRNRFARIHELKPCKPPKPRRAREKRPHIVKPFTDEEREKYSQVINDNLPLIWYVVNRTPGLKDRLMHRRDEALSVGMLALCHAARNHDPNRGTFSTLACINIRHAMFRLLEGDRRNGKRKEGERVYGTNRELRHRAARSIVDLAAMRETLAVA